MKEIFKKIIEKQEELFQDLNVIEVLSHVDFDSTIQNSLKNFLESITKESIEIVKQEAEKYDNGWIPCDDVHFPEENVYVRVTTWTKTEKIGFRRDGKWFVYGSDGMEEATVLAWQPTQPYQPKRK